MPHTDRLIAPIVYTVPLQLLAYHVAVLKGTDIDQPRNLAKSVTVDIAGSPPGLAAANRRWYSPPPISGCGECMRMILPRFLALLDRTPGVSARRSVHVAGRRNRPSKR